MLNFGDLVTPTNKWQARLDHPLRGQIGRVYRVDSRAFDGTVIYQVVFGILGKDPTYAFIEDELSLIYES